MRIGIDASSVPARPAGAGVYAIELVRALAGGWREDGFCLFSSSAAFDSALATRRNWRRERSNSGRAKRLLWQQMSLPRRLSRLEIDVLHSTHHDLPLRPTRAAKVVTVHDLTFLRIPQRYPLARRLYMQTMTRLGARVADVIIVPSQTVGEETKSRLGVAAQRIAVVYEAAADRFGPIARQEAEQRVRAMGVELPYVLSVGSREPGKNRARLLRALRKLRDSGIERRLVIVGQDAWRFEREDALVSELHLDDVVQRLGYVDDGDMPALYAAADVLAFPSLYEGFGLPVIEAMACGTPVLTSNVSATAEVGAGAALLVDPVDTAAITEGLATILADGNMRASMSQRGLARAAEFSWARAARETHDVYARAASARA